MPIRREHIYALDLKMHLPHHHWWIIRQLHGAICYVLTNMISTT